MAGHGEKLTRKQDQAIAALLSAPTIPEAAQQAGVGEHTLRRWLQDAAFSEAYRAARRQVVQQAIVQVQRATKKAVETLLGVMADNAAPSSAKVRAAQVILDLALRVVELEDIETRLVALEAQAQGRS
jgi:hypothetical protein